MPELPEVETTRRGIEPLVKGKRILKVRVHNPSLRWPVPVSLSDILSGQRVVNVDRRSKYLLLQMDQGTLIVHLGMTGHLRMLTAAAERRKHDHVEICFEDGSCLCYNDARRFGAIFWTTDDPLQHARLRSLGPEPLGDDFNPDYLYSRSRDRRVAVKPFLMDAGVVVGVGNIYASEALFRAGIDPRRPAGKVSRRSFGQLVAAVKEVLTEAIAAGGTTIRDFTDSEGRPGYFRQELRVYGRSEQPCVSCREPIRQVQLGQRSTYFCPKCQK